MTPAVVGWKAPISTLAKAEREAHERFRIPYLAILALPHEVGLTPAATHLVVFLDYYQPPIPGMRNTSVRHTNRLTATVFGCVSRHDVH